MEAGVTLREWLNDRFENIDSRIKSNHDSIAKQRSRTGKQQEKIIEMEGALEGLADDIAEMKGTMKWIVRGLFGAIAVGLMFVVAVASLVIQAAG